MKRKEHIEDACYERNYVYNFHFHLIWVTKCRQEIFTTADLVAEMKDILSHEADLISVIIEEIEVMPNHVHLLISFKPKYAATDIVKSLKGHSAKVFFKRHPDIKASKLWGGHLWSHSYFMSTVGKMSKKTIEKYIRNQHSK